MFATINFCISGSDTSRCYHTCSVTSEMGNAIQRKIDSTGHNTFHLNDGTILSGVVICDWTAQPVCMMNEFGYLKRLLNINL